MTWLHGAKARWATGVAAAGILAGTLLSLSIVRADNTHSCSPACPSTPAAVVIVPASYKLWPSGAKTFLQTHWSPNASSGLVTLTNSGTSTSSSFGLTVAVENHDPATESLQSSTAYTYALPALAPDQDVSLSVPLDYSQCDIYVIFDLAAPATLRTGNPAAC